MTRAYIATYDGEYLEEGVTNEYETSFVTECDKTISLALLAATHAYYPTSDINWQIPTLGDEDEDVFFILKPRSFKQIESLRKINDEEYLNNDGAMN